MKKNKLKVSIMALSVVSVFSSLALLSTNSYAQSTVNNTNLATQTVQTTTNTVNNTVNTVTQTTTVGNTVGTVGNNSNTNTVNSNVEHIKCSCIPPRKHKIYKLNNNHTARDLAKHVKYKTIVKHSNTISLTSVPDNLNNQTAPSFDIPLTTHSEIIKDAGWFSSKRKIAFSLSTDYQDGSDKTLTPDYFVSNPSVLIVNQSLTVAHMQPAEYDSTTGRFFLDFKDYDNSDCYRAFIVANPRENGKTEILAADFFKDGTTERVADEVYPQDNFINPNKTCKQVKGSDLYGDTTTIVEENGYTLDISNDQMNEQLPEAGGNVSLTVSLLKDGWYVENLPILPDSTYGMQLIFIDDQMDDFSIIEPDTSSFNRKNPDEQSSPFKFKVQFKQPGIYHALVKFVDKKSGETMVMPIKVTVNDGTNLSDRYKYDDLTPPEPKPNAQ